MSMMTRKADKGKLEILDAIRSCRQELEVRYGVQRLGLFGSCIRNQAGEGSDIDILVSYNRDIDLFEFLDLRDFLESRLHGRVDLVMESALKPAIGKRILSEVEYVSEKREISDYLDDLLISITDIAMFVDGMDFNTCAADKKSVNAVIRSLEVIGEATKRIPAAFRDNSPDIPWSRMAGMRDVLIHDYMGVDLKTVWKVATERLPEIKARIALLAART